MSKTLLELKPNSTIRHIKRGSLYRIVGWTDTARQWQDNDKAIYGLAPLHGMPAYRKAILIPVGELHEIRALCQDDLFEILALTLQVDPGHDWAKDHRLMVYRHLVGEELGEAYARPISEFTTDRFQLA